MNDKIEKLAILHTETIYRRLPDLESPKDSVYFNHELQKDIPAMYQIILKNIYIWNSSSISRNRFGFPLYIEVWQVFLNRLKGMLKNWRELPKKWISVKKAIIVTDQFSNGYFHWLGDVLPKLEFIARVKPEVLKSHVLVLPAMARFDYVEPSLKALQLQQIIWSDKNRGVKAEEAFILTSMAPTGNYRPVWMKNLREKMTAKSGLKEKKTDQRIWVSREKAPKRRVRNEQSLLPLLESYGFRKVYLEEMDFESQVELLSNTSVLAGTHGAGLTNMLFMPEGGKVLELRFAGDIENNCYYSLADAMGLNYFYLTCEPFGINKDPHNADIIVDPDKLRKILDNCLGTL